MYALWLTRAGSLWISSKITFLATPAIRPVIEQDIHKTFANRLSHPTFRPKNMNPMLLCPLNKNLLRAIDLLLAEEPVLSLPR